MSPSGAAKDKFRLWLCLGGRWRRIFPAVGAIVRVVRALAPTIRAHHHFRTYPFGSTKIGRKQRNEITVKLALSVKTTSQKPPNPRRSVKLNRVFTRSGPFLTQALRVGAAYGCCAVNRLRPSQSPQQYAALVTTGVWEHEATTSVATNVSDWDVRSERCQANRAQKRPRWDFTKHFAAQTQNITHFIRVNYPSFSLLLIKIET